VTTSISATVNCDFRAGLAKGELLIQACKACDQILEYAARTCGSCGSARLRWCRASGKGRLRGVIEMSVSYSREFIAPYKIASVELDEGPHLLAQYDGPGEDLNLEGDVVANISGGRLVFRSIKSS
jgi:uncharacterized OB-fold protein